MKFSDAAPHLPPLENAWQKVQPRISVVLPTFNRHAEGRLLPCIESVLAQSFQNFELIIYDDGSTDGSAEVITSLAQKDARIIFISLAQNSGLPAMLVNAGILRARGEFTSFIFDDNTWHVQALEQMLAAAESSQADVVHAGMGLRTSDGRSRPLGNEPASLASLELTNSIPNGAVLVHRRFWQRYGLYDPHLLLRRVCDWDLWLRSLKQGAYFHHLPLEIGLEYGLTLQTSLGNSIPWDYKIVAAYLQNEAALASRTAALLPENIPHYDLLDAEQVLPFVRNWAEWDAYESAVTQPYLKRHPEVEYQSALRHNRRYDAHFQAYKLNVSRPIFHPRKRILLICEQNTRLVSEWKWALSSNPDHILLAATPGSAILLDPASLDQVLLFDSPTAGLLPFLRKCRKSGVSLVFVAGGKPLPAEHEPLLAACDDGFSFQDHPPAYSSLHTVSFLPTPLPEAAPPQALSWAVFARRLPEGRLLETLAGQNPPAPLPVYLPPGAQPALSPANKPSIRLIQTAEPLTRCILRQQQTAWLVMPGTLESLTRYERSLLEEDLLRQGSILLEWTANLTLPTPSERLALLQQARGNWMSGAIGLHPQGRWLQLKNLAAGVHLRARLAARHGKSSARDVQTLVFVNSRLFGGSEVYGFLTAWTLGRIGFNIQTCAPDFDHYRAGGAKMAEWLAEHSMPAPISARYGFASRLFFDPDFYEDNVNQETQALANWIHQRETDLIFCSGFIPEPILAAGKRRPVFAAFFPPWGYALNRMTFLRHYLDGLASDCEWALQIWGRWLPEPRACIPSLIESGRFKILNQDLQAEPVQIALVGTMVGSKGHRQALLAVEQLLAEGYDIHLNIYGFELEMYADFIRQMKKLAESPRLKGHVTFHGFVDDSMDINRQNHIIFSASLAEGLPQALAFHQAAGLLPVAAPAGGIPEIVLDGETGFLAEGFEVHHLVQALRRALQNRPDWPRLVANGRNLLIETASEPVFVNRMLAWMDRGLEIRHAEGRRYFTSRPDLVVAFPATETIPDPRPQNFITPAPAAVTDESRMVCSPSLSVAPLIYQFKSPQDDLHGLRIRLATYASLPQGELWLELYSSGGSHRLRQVSIPAAAILDNVWMEIRFEPLHNLLNQTLEVRLGARLEQGRLAVYEIPAVEAENALKEKAIRLGRRVLPLIGRQSGNAIFPGEGQ